MSGNVGVPGGQSGAIGTGLGAPVPLQLVVPPLTGAGAPNLAAALSPAPVPVLHAAVSAAVPALPQTAIPAALVRAAAPKNTQSFETVEKVETAEAGVDEGRALFDQGGAVKPAGFDRGEPKVLNPNLLPEEVYSPQIMREARRAGEVFEVARGNLKNMKPGVEHNFVIVQHRDGTIAMTVGRLSDAAETGVKHVALGDGRGVLFSGVARIDAATRRPTFDFDSGMYSSVGYDKRWAPTPGNARALAAHAEAILGVPVDVYDHFARKPIDFRAPKPAAPASIPLWDKVRNLLSIGEAAPAWPGKAGDAVRVGKVTTVLDKRAGDGGTSTVWKSRDGQYAIKFIHPGARNVPGVEEEAATLRAIAGSDLPVAKLVAESRDGSVQVKEFIEGETAHALLGRGVFARQHSEGWREFAAKLIGAGFTADLAPANLIWQHWRSRWVIVDADGLRAGNSGVAADVLRQMLTPGVLNTGLDAGEFLSGLRARLGPDSAQWKKTRAEMLADPKLAKFVPALAEYDARLTQAPVINFEPSPKAAGGLDDSVVSARELSRRLGYDPHRTKEKVKLHGEDPGKLNTVILAIEEPGKTKLVLKIANWPIIRDEAAARRLARRFFGRYFRVPASLSVNAGHDSYMAMEKADATPSYNANPFTLEQRVAAALFLRTFGITDVNPGNVLVAGDRGLPWLIDFEQAFSRSDPSSGRHIPDERIALEKPWMSRHIRNRIEDYQPAIRAWRAELAKPESQNAIAADLVASGYSKEAAAALLHRFNLNAADLDWTLQNDADFVNQFVDRNAVRR